MDAVKVRVEENNLTDSVMLFPYDPNAIVGHPRSFQPLATGIVAFCQKIQSVLPYPLAEANLPDDFDALFDKCNPKMPRSCLLQQYE